METIKIIAEPQLSSPIAVIGFGGWANAGEIATSALKFLEKGLDTRPLARFDPDPYYDFAVHRPRARIRGGHVESLTLPENEFSFIENKGRNSIILFRGEEPHLCWPTFVQEMLGLLRRFGVNLVVTIGGTYDERLHTDPPKVSVVAEDMVLAEGLFGLGGSPGEYKGPVSIHTLLYTACRERGINVVSLWGHVPVYVQTGNFGTVQKIMELIAALGGPRLDLDPLVEARQEMEEQLESIISHSPKLSNYVKKLKTDLALKNGGEKLLPKNKAKVIPIRPFENED